jgi:hypothetical protein
MIFKNLVLQALGTIRIRFLQKKSKKIFHACVPLTPPTLSHYGSVWLLPVISLLLTNTVSSRRCGLVYPYEWRLERFLGGQKEKEHGPFSTQSSLIHSSEILYALRTHTSSTIHNRCGSMVTILCCFYSWLWIQGIIFFSFFKVCWWPMMPLFYNLLISLSYIQYIHTFLHPWTFAEAPLQRIITLYKIQWKQKSYKNS